MNPGSTAAPVLRATWARPVAVQASMPKNFTNSPCGGVMLVSIRMPTVSPCAHGGQQAARKVVLVQHAVAVQAADAVHKCVQPAVVETADDHAHRMAHQRVVKAGELPCAQVAGDDQHAFAARLRRQVVVQTLGAHPAAGIFGV